MRNNVNVLEFCLSPDLGGLELFMLNCFESFKDKTVCKIVIAPNKKLDKYLKNGEKFYIKRDKFFPIFPALKLAKYIDKNNIDIVHFHWTRDINVVVLAKIFSKQKPKIIQTRNMTMTRFKNDFYHRWLYKHIDAIHAVTHQVKNQIEEFIPNNIQPKVKVIYMGTKEKEIDTEKIKKLKEKYLLDKSFVVGIVGRIEDGKGQYLVIEALSKLRDLDIKALIIGHTMDENYLNTLKAKVKNLSLEKNVIFTGFTKEVDAHMKLCDSVVLATKKETFGLVVIEAMVNKACMIATNTGGPLEIIDDGIDGILFDRTSENLAQKLKKLYDDSQLKNSLALAGYKKVKEKFDNQKQNDKLFQFLKQI